MVEVNCELALAVGIRWYSFRDQLEFGKQFRGLSEL
jgi:hypothetical protein